MLKNKGVWLVTQAGIDAYETFSDPVAFHREISRLYALNSSDASSSGSRNESDEKEILPSIEGEISISLDKAEGDARDQIKQYIACIDPYRFQNLVAALLTAIGLHVAYVARRGPDGGVDIVALKDDLGIESPKIKVQIKREMREITEAGLREFLSLIGDNEAGIFVSSGGFDEAAKRKSRDDRRKLTLIDAERLIDLWIFYYEKLGDREKQYMPLKPVWYLRNPAEDAF